MSSNRFRPSRLLSGYRVLALFALNTVLVFVVGNLVAAVLLRLSPEEPPGALAHDPELLSRVYPGRDRNEVRELLRETWSRAYVYEPYTQFREAEVSGRFVNVAAAGFRRTGYDLPWPPADDRLNVFVLGGSTTFGYGLADEEAIPARLHTALERRCDSDRVAVYNFARSNYYSSQERVLFQRMLVAGHGPRAAVFVDGLNEFGYADDAPKFTARLEAIMRETGPQLARRLLVGLPLPRLLKSRADRPDLRQRISVDASMANGVVERWLANRRQIRSVAAAAGVEAIFVWQPVPSYGYDLEYHLFGEELDAEAAIAAGYERVDALRRDPAGELASGFLWLGDLQRGRAEPLYVDRVHYTAAFADRIAGEIAAPVAEALCPAVTEGESSPAR